MRFKEAAKGLRKHFRRVCAADNVALREKCSFHGTAKYERFHLIIENAARLLFAPCKSRRNLGQKRQLRHHSRDASNTTSSNKLIGLRSLQP